MFKPVLHVPEQIKAHLQGDTFEAMMHLQGKAFRDVPGRIEQHLDTIAAYWIECRDRGESLAITTTRNEHVDMINDRIQTERWHRLEIDRTRRVSTADGIGAWVGDLIATRRNDRSLITSTGQFVRNRDQWVVTAIDERGEISAARVDGGGSVVLPAEYARDHVRLGYAATEPGNQSDTQDRSITLATGSTTGRGLYVGMTRGRQANHVLVITDIDDLTAARDVLECVVANDRADVPAVARRVQLGAQPEFSSGELRDVLAVQLPRASQSDIGLEI